MALVTGLAFLGDSVADLHEFEVAEPAATEVRIAIKASGLCGSDLHFYHNHDGLRDQANHNLIVAGHEPAGVVETVGRRVKDFVSGDRVFVYHIMGCGNCYNCRLGHPVVCTSERKAAYGWQRNGAHAPLLLVEERSVIRIPEPLSFIDGAMISCGVGTAYSALLKAALKPGQTLLVSGLGPVGMAVTLLASSMGIRVIGSDPNAERKAAARKHGLADAIDFAEPGNMIAEVLTLTGGRGADAAIECSGASSARLLCIRAAAIWGRVVLVGVGFDDLVFEPTRDVIAKQLTIIGSWVSSQAEMQECADLLARRGLHPEVLVTEKLSLADGVDAYRRFAEGRSGKMVFVF